MVDPLLSVSCESESLSLPTGRAAVVEGTTPQRSIRHRRAQDVETLTEILSDRIHDQNMQALEREPILSTTGTRAAIGLLAERLEALEATVAEQESVIRRLTRSRRFRGL